MFNKCSNPQEMCDMNFPKQLTLCVCMHEAKLVSKKILPMLLNGPKPPIVVHLSRWNDYLTIEYFLCHLEGTPLTIEPGIHKLFV
jgi:hypothetical protein